MEEYSEISGQIGLEQMYSGSEGPADTPLAEILAVFNRAIAGKAP